MARLLSDGVDWEEEKRSDGAVAVWDEADCEEEKKRGGRKSPTLRIELSGWGRV